MGLVTCLAEKMDSAGGNLHMASPPWWPQDINPSLDVSLVHVFSFSGLSFHFADGFLHCEKCFEDTGFQVRGATSISRCSTTWFSFIPFPGIPD